MYLPPAAAWNVDGRPLTRRLLVALVLVAASVVTFFCLSQRFGPNAWVLTGALAVCALSATSAWSKVAVGQLRWDGEQWHWSGTQDLAVTQLKCALDLQRVLLLRIDCEAGPSLWLWLHSPTMDQRWRALRRAVVAPRQAPRQPVADSLPE